MKERLVQPPHDPPAFRLPRELAGRMLRLRPTGYGLAFLAVLAVMLIGSVRYNNNLGFLLSFLLGSMAFVSVRHTRNNLAGLKIVSCEALPVFAGDSSQFEVVADPGSAPRHALSLAFERTEDGHLNLKPGRPGRLVLETKPLKRGLFSPGVLKVSSCYPMGLFVVRAVVRTDAAGLVYPRSRGGFFDPGHLGDGTHDRGEGRRGGDADDFKGLRAYEPGDPLQRLSWKTFSRGMGLHTKEFVSTAGTAVNLDWFRFRGLAVEKRLERLCGMVLEAQKRHLRFGLRLPGKSISAGYGPAHARHCLAELALFPGEEAQPAGTVK